MKAVLLCTFTLVLFSCSLHDPQPQAGPVTDPYAPSRAMVNEAMQQLHNGDLLVRSGQEISSQFIRNFNRKDKTYSHAGLIFFENGYPYVYHILAGTENPGDRLKKDTLAHFCNPRSNSGFAIYRFDLDSNEVNKLDEDLRKWYVEGLQFDSSFDLRTSERMYCSEMIKKGLEDATGGRISIATTRPTAAEASFFATHLKRDPAYLAGLDIVTIDNLFLNPHCRLVARYNFNQ